MSPERLRELEWAATYLTVNKKRQGCKCAGSCPRCKGWREQEEKITPAAVLELVKAVRSWPRSPFDVDPIEGTPEEVEEYRRFAREKATCAGCGRIKVHLHSEGHAQGCRFGGRS